MKAVILQPMYLPWMGYFGLIDQADVFVFYDDVQFVRRSWQRRNRIKNPNEDFMWLTVPVLKDYGQKINDVKIKNDLEWESNHWKSIKAIYGGATYFEEYKEDFKTIYNQKWQYLAELDITLIRKIARLLGIEDTKFKRSSNMDIIGEKTDRLINVLKELGADEYISGPAAKDYIEQEKFRKENIVLYWHEFNHPKYSQVFGDFVSHLSIIDLLFTQGENSLEIIRKGEKHALVRDPKT